MTLLARFTPRQVAISLRDQSLVAHDPSLAVELASIGQLSAFQPGDVLMAQDGEDTHLCLLLAGSVAIEVNGKRVAERRRHQHVGEMAIIDPAAKRSATVRALEETVVFRIEEPAFVELADKYPILWRRLALELACRLRERSKTMRKPNEVPHVFIGSTAEKLDMAREIQRAVAFDNWVVGTWADAMFRAGDTPIESLVKSLDRLDFSLLLVTADDMTESRGAQSASPRDNVIFELGLAYGALGRSRTFIIREREVALRLPSDLIGVRALEIKPGKPSDLVTRVAPLVHEFRQIVTELGVRVG